MKTQLLVVLAMLALVVTLILGLAFAGELDTNGQYVILFATSIATTVPAVLALQKAAQASDAATRAADDIRNGVLKSQVLSAVKPEFDKAAAEREAIAAIVREQLLAEREADEMSRTPATMDKGVT